MSVCLLQVFARVILAAGGAPGAAQGRAGPDGGAGPRVPRPPEHTLPVRRRLREAHSCKVPRLLNPNSGQVRSHKHLLAFDFA